MQHIRLHGDAATGRKWVNWAKNKLTQLLTLQGDPDTFHKRYSFSDVDIKLSKVAPDEYIDIYGKGNYLLIVWLGTKPLKYNVKKFFHLSGDVLSETTDALGYVDDGLYEPIFPESSTIYDNIFDISFNVDGGGLGVPADFTAGYDSKGPARYILNPQNYFDPLLVPFTHKFTYSAGASYTYYFTQPIPSLITNYLGMRSINTHTLIAYKGSNILYSAGAYELDPSNESINIQHVSVSENFGDFLPKHAYYSFIPLDGSAPSHYPLQDRSGARSYIGCIGVEFKEGALLVPRYFVRDARNYVGTIAEVHRYYDFYEPIDIATMDESGLLTYTDNAFRRTWDNTDPLTHNGYLWKNDGRRHVMLVYDDVPPDPPPTPAEFDEYSYHRYVAYPQARIPFGAYGIDAGDYIEVAANAQIPDSSRWDNCPISLYIGGNLVESHIQDVQSSWPYRYYGEYYIFVPVFEYAYYPLNIFHDKDGKVACVYVRSSRQSFVMEDITDGSTNDIYTPCAPDVDLYDPVPLNQFELLKVHSKLEYFLYFNGRLTKLTYTDKSPLYTDQMEYCVVPYQTTGYEDTVHGWGKSYAPTASHTFANRGYDEHKNAIPSHDTRFVGRAYLSMDKDVCLAMLEIFDMKISNELFVYLPDGFSGCEYDPQIVHYAVLYGGKYDTSINSWPPAVNDESSELGNLVDRVGVVIQSDGTKQYIKDLDKAFLNPSSGTGSPYKCINGIGLFKLE